MPGIGVFSASVQIQAARPVYNSNYNSLIFNFADRDWDFQYLETIPLEFNDNMFNSNITSMLAYYAYTILGMTTTHLVSLAERLFPRALQVINTAQQSNQTGWQTIGAFETGTGLMRI